MKRSQNLYFGNGKIAKDPLDSESVKSHFGDGPQSGVLFENLVQNKNDRWLNSTEAADYLRLTVNALRIAVCRGHVRSYKFGRRLRFKLSELSRLPNFSEFIPKKGI